jgi:predicted nucleotidyltransferase
MDKINITEKHKGQIFNILAKHLEKVEVWAFGSRVDFTNRENSDLDLVVVGAEKQSLMTLENLRLAFEQSLLPFEVDLHDYQRLSANMKSQIEKNYLILWQA